MARDLSNQVIIITGASSGIGAATAVACARAGLDCVLHGRDVGRLTEVAGRVRAAGRAAQFVVGDIRENGLSNDLLDAATRSFGRFDVVFANAGYGFKKPTLEMSLDEVRQIFDVNFFAALDLLMAAARRMMLSKTSGHLLMCSSAVAKFTFRNFAAYSATKAAQSHFCRAMRLELRPHGIEVSCVHPVNTRTGFLEAAATYLGRPFDPKAAYRHGQGLLLQRPEKVARAVVRCLRNPRPEVWTSRLALWGAGLMTAFPRLMDVLGDRD